jgi:hypothetical protein
MCSGFPAHDRQTLSMLLKNRKEKKKVEDE